MDNFIKENKISIAITGTNGAAGTTAINGATLDLANMDEVTVLVAMGPIVATAVTSIKWQEGDLANLSDAADVAGTNQAIAVADADKVFYINIVKPRKRYGRVVVTRGTANATVGSALYIQCDGRTEPVVQGTNVVGEFWVSPALGTA